MERSRGLDGGVLKGIAAALMLTDHVGAILLPEVPVLRCVGRLAFPIFAFFIAEGYAHTRDFGRYFRRLAILAVVSEIPFNLENGAVFDLTRQNVLFTFCLALLTLRGLEALGRERGFGRWAGCGLVLAAGFAAGELLRTDYGGWGVVTVALLYLCRDGRYAKLWLLLAMAAVNGLGMGSLTMPVFGGEMPIQIFAVAALPMIWLYNGQAGPKGLRRAFYVFYPAHLLVLEGIRTLT
ncbi:TraX family protein [Vescimonas sp.]|uniref:TraX family protein n=1 Tax=Vescimonas sp. TaxID=2892404 RepID=UPI00307C9809